MAIMSVHNGAQPWVLPSRAEEGRVVSLLHECLDAAGGTWVVEVSHSGALAHCWVIDIVRTEDGTRRNVLVDLRAHEPAARLRTVLAALENRQPDSAIATRPTRTKLAGTAIRNPPLSPARAVPSG